MTATSLSTTELIISAVDLREEIASGRKVVLLEIGRERDETEAIRAAGHLPGAHYVDLPSQLAGDRHEGSGNNPLPSEAAIQEQVRRWGIDDDSLVVVYTHAGAPVATRGWWVLKWAGVPDVRYLDGGVAAWVAAGGELSDEAAPPADREGTFTVAVGSLPVLGTEEAAELARTGTLLDARGAGAYRGENGGGHIPGALSVPSSVNLGDGGTLRTDEELRAHYAALGVDGRGAVGVYCGGGVGATLDILALAKVGIVAALYPGSFSAWSSDAARPVATGDQPG